MTIPVLFTTYFLSLIFGTCIFIGLFHVRFFKKVNVFFYRGILLLILASVITLVVLLFLKSVHFTPFLTFQDIALILTILFSANLIFFTHLPVTANRSVTIFILGYMNRNKTSFITKKDIKKALDKEYFEKNREIERRFHEQIVSGNIYQKNNAYKITKRGETLIYVYKIMADLFKIDRSNLSG